MGISYDNRICIHTHIVSKCGRAHPLAHCITNKTTLGYIEIITYYSIGIHYNMSKMHNSKTTTNLGAGRYLYVSNILCHMQKKAPEHTANSVTR